MEGRNAGLRALVFGEVLVDCFESPGSPPREVPGGAPLNVAIHLVRGGWDVSVLSRVGPDERGRRLRTLMEQEGLSTGLLQEDEQAPTGWVSVRIAASGDADFRIHEGVAWDHIELPAELPEVDLLYHGSLAVRCDTSRRTLAALRARSIPWRVFDVNLRQHHWSPREIERGLEAATLVKMNEEELPVVCDRLGVEASAPSLLARYPSLRYLCLTRGARGAELHGRVGEPVVRPAEAGPVVDTVGAGDALCAGLARALVEGRSPAEALEEGSCLAARVVAQEGAIPPRE